MAKRDGIVKGAISMNAQEYLSQALHLDARIEAKLEQIERLRVLSARRSAAFGCAMRSGQTAEIAAELTASEQELDAEIKRLVGLRREISATISRVPDARLRTLLELRYINGAPWKLVAKRMDYTVRNVYRLHEAALQQIDTMRVFHQFADKIP